MFFMPDFLPQKDRDRKEAKEKREAKKELNLADIKMHLPSLDDLKKEELKEETVVGGADLQINKQKVKKEVKKIENRQVDYVAPKKRSILTQSSDLVDKVFKTKSLFSFFKKKDKGVKKKIKTDKHEHVELNLISPDLFKVTEKQFWLRFYSFLSSLLGGVFILVLLFLGLKFYHVYIVKELKEVKTETNNLESEIYTYQADQDNFIKLGDRAQKLKNLLDNRNSAVEVFNQLEVFTLPQVYYKSVGLAGNEMKLIGSTDKYMNVGKQLLVFQNAKDFIQDVSIPAARVESLENSKAVSFEVTLKLKE